MSADRRRPQRGRRVRQGLRPAQVPRLRATVLVYASLLIALIPLVWVLWTVISRGLSVLLHATWWTHTMRNVTYTDPGGGALHAIVGTLEQVAICTVISVPVAILVGVYLVEYGRGTLAQGPRRSWSTSSPVSRRSSRRCSSSR